MATCNIFVSKTCRDTITMNLILIKHMENKQNN